MTISIGMGMIEDALIVEESIPEFGAARTKSDYEERLENRPSLILIAHDEEQPVGFKVGYEIESGVFYSWLGGVNPSYRRLGLAQQLLEMQETWVQHHGYQQIQVKTMNIFPGMLILLIKNGYEIIDLEEQDGPERTKILFQKVL